ncbi:MAG: ABC transporter transmembrane domain-containing protein, partial [Candidatus Methanomethyliaceae archaeon]|nr:ABC transporter transmembrane domain-containing protein [Candidatus Methanomethyliaceae archaeon]
MSGPWRAFSIEEEERKRTVPDRVLIRRLYNYVKPFRKNLTIAIIAIVLSSLTGLASPYMHKIAIDQIIQTGELMNFLWWIPLFTIIVLCNFFFQHVQIFQMRIIGENVVSAIRDEIIERLQIISLRYFSESEIGRIISRPINDANNLRIFLRMGFTSILVDTSSILGAFIIMFMLDLELTLIALSFIPLALLVFLILGKYSRKAYRKTLSTLAGLTARMQEDISGIKIIQSFVQEERTRKIFEEMQEENIDANKRALLVSSIYQPVVIMMRIIGTIIILLCGSLFVTNGSITIGTLVAFIEYQFAYFMPLVDLVNVSDQYNSAMAAVERLFDLVDAKVEVI